MTPTIYPLLFQPVFKNTIWGGDGISRFKGIESAQGRIGESWEISHLEGDLSTVSNGVLIGKNIEDIISIYGSELLGVSVKERHGDIFPLLIKFIDAADDLSIQVHPNDKLAMERHNSLGKTEMWYVVKADEGASLYSGFSRRINADEYVRRVADGTLGDVLQHYDVKAGDVFFLPAGRVHAIGKGCLVAEIQQTSNITYRIYDYGRKDEAGNERELHTQLAKDAINFNVSSDYRTHYTSRMDIPVTLAYSKFFITRLIDISRKYSRNLQILDSFVIYICLEGSFTLTDNNGYAVRVNQGETVLLPASTKHIDIQPSPSTKVLETYMDYLAI